MAQDYGWNATLNSPQLNWELFVNNVQSYITKLNEKYEIQLGEIGVDFVNAEAKINSENQVQVELNGVNYTVKAKNIGKICGILSYLLFLVIATGQRQEYPNDFSNSNFSYKRDSITNNEIFSLKKNPGRTLVLGGHFVAIEVASSLSRLGIEVILASQEGFLPFVDQFLMEKLLETMRNQKSSNVG